MAGRVGTVRSMGGYGRARPSGGGYRRTQVTRWAAWRVRFPRLHNNAQHRAQLTPHVACGTTMRADVAPQSNCDFTGSFSWPSCRVRTTVEGRYWNEKTEPIL